MVFSGSHCFSVVVVVLIVGSQWFSLDPSCGHWFSLVVSCFQWFSLVFSDSQWFSDLWCSLVLSCSQ